MQDTVEIIQEYLESAEMYSLTPEQKTYLKGRFNYFGNFEYGITKDRDFVFNTKKDSFNRMEYYMGLEYARDDIIMKLQIENDIIVIYDGSNERMRSIFEYLMPEEFCKE